MTLRYSVSVGITSETAQLAVASIRAWWRDLGSARYPAARALQITADCGGGNGNRIRLWKTELQKLADDTGLEIHVCHFPPGTSRWKKIEVTDAELAAVNLTADPFHPEWNYTIAPSPNPAG
jgi:Rhodopirellula transposase DDE domain